MWFFLESFISCHRCERNFNYLNWLSTRICGAGRPHVGLCSAHLVLLYFLIKCIGVEAQSTLGSKTFLPENKYMYEKSTKCQHFTWYLPDNARILHDNFPKNIFPIFFFWAGEQTARAPCPPSPAPMIECQRNVSYRTKSKLIRLLSYRTRYNLCPKYQGNQLDFQQSTAKSTQSI